MDQAGMPGVGGSDQYATVQWREQGFPSEEDMLDWLENRNRTPRTGTSRRGRLLRAALGCSLVAAGFTVLSRLWTR